MKLKLLLIASGALLFSSLEAQIFETETLEINNLKIALRSNGDLHRNADLSDALTEMPAGSGVTCVFAQSLWLGGWQATNIRVAANTYNQNGNDFHPGPVANTYGSAYDATYDKVWRLTRDEIEDHIANYSVTGYIVPDEIASWPANGNVANGEAQNLAPYADLNSNDIYEPELGEYPTIRGDEALYIIYNDDRTIHTSSFGEKITAEIHLMLYAYSNSGVESNDNVVFSHYEIYNRSQSNNFPEFYASSWLDFDIGEGFDDFIGTNPNLNMIYAYNGAASDSDYGLNPPAYGHMLLNKTLDKSMYYHNTTSLYNGNPVASGAYVNYMKSVWGDATSLINPVDSNPIDFAFPGDSDTTLYANWSEVSEGNPPSDRRMLGSAMVEDFGPGNVICLDYASIYARDNTLNNIEQVDHLFSLAQEVQNFYDGQYDNCGDLSDLTVTEIDVNQNQISINQIDGHITLSIKESLHSDLQINVIDALGRLVTNQVLKQGNMTIDFDIAEPNKGIYFIECRNKEISNSIKTIIY